MRLYSLAWGLLGAVVMFTLARRISQSRIIGTVRSGLLSAAADRDQTARTRPNRTSPARVLGLIAVDLAIRAIGSGRQRHVIATGIACGAAASMVLSGWTTIVMLPGDGLFHAARSAARVGRGNRFLQSSCTPPAILMSLIHLLGDRAVLNSNLGNSTAMYQTPLPPSQAFSHSVRLLYDGGSTVVIFGICAILIGTLKKSKTGVASSRRHTPWPDRVRDARNSKAG